MRGQLQMSRRGKQGVVGAMLTLGLLALMLANCTPIVTDRDATRTAEAVIVGARLQQTAEVEQYAQMVASATARMVDAQTQVAVRQTSVAGTQAAATQQAAATATALFEAQQRANATATQQAAGLSAEAAEYAQKGWLPGAAGRYHRLDEYTGEEPNRGKVLVRGTGYDPTEFVIRARVQYQNAARGGDYARSSCGFLLWRLDGENYYQVYAAMDGNVYANALVGNRFIPLGRGYFGLPGLPDGEYELTVIANRERIRVLLNDTLVKTFLTVENSRMEGKLYFAVTSGVEKDFGTRCAFTDAELWEVSAGTQ